MKLFESIINVTTSAALLFAPMPASAAPTTCWLQMPGESSADPQRCDLRHSRNAAGLNVVHLTTITDGETAHIVLWSTSDGQPSYAEVNLPVGEGNRQTFVFDYSVDSDGDIKLHHKPSRMLIWFTPLGTSAPADGPSIYRKGVLA